MATCVGRPERSDEDIAAKAACLARFEAVSEKCGPFDLGKLHAERAARFDVAKLENRINTKSEAIVVHQTKAAADAAAKNRRCLGPGVLQIVIALQMGRDMDASTLRDCTYAITMGRVTATTRDGWMIVEWGSGMAAAFKSRKRHADGSFLQTRALARFNGLQVFERLDGGTATMPTFVLDE